MRVRHRLLAVVLFASPLLGALATRAVAQPAPAPPGAPSVIGTINVAPTVSQQGTCAPTPLQKLGVVPLITTDANDALVQLVVGRDLDLSGTYDVLGEAGNPAGPFTRGTNLDLAQWRLKDAEYVVRVYATTTASNVELVGELYLTPPKTDPSVVAEQDAGPPSSPPAAMPAPAFATKIETTPDKVRLGIHRLVDQLLGAITGTPGSFASQLTYSGQVGEGRFRQVFVIDADGHNLHGLGPANATALSPVWGPGNEIFYALSPNFHRYDVVHGQAATLLPLHVTGSVMSLAFNHDKTKLAYDDFENGQSRIFVSAADGSSPQAVSTAPLAHHPAFGPNDMLAYVAGAYAQQVYLNGRAITPPGAWASAPTICDTPNGVQVLYSVGIGAGSSLMASDVDGQNAHPLVTANGGAYPACSPDGRLLAYFSYQTKGQGPGIYVTPLAHPCNGKRVSSVAGETLHWEAVPAATAAH